MKKKISWYVKYFNFNSYRIEDYDVLKYREDIIKELKKKCATKEEFSEQLRKEFQYHYWSRSEYELIVEIDNNSRVWLKPWCGCKEPEKARIDVTDEKDFNWINFAKHHINKQIYRNKAKIDIYDQLIWKWTELVDYLWCTRLKYERKLKEKKDYEKEK